MNGVVNHCLRTETVRNSFFHFFLIFIKNFYFFFPLLFSPKERCLFGQVKKPFVLLVFCLKFKSDCFKRGLNILLCLESNRLFNSSRFLISYQTVLRFKLRVVCLSITLDIVNEQYVSFMFCEDKPCLKSIYYRADNSNLITENPNPLKLPIAEVKEILCLINNA